MLKEVIKKGGKKATFRPAKLKRAIQGAAKDAKLPAARVKTVVNKVYRAVMKSLAKRKSAATATLRKRVLGQLDKIEPAAAKAWRKHDRKRSAQRRR